MIAFLFISYYGCGTADDCKCLQNKMFSCEWWESDEPELIANQNWFLFTFHFIRHSNGFFQLVMSPINEIYDCLYFVVWFATMYFKIIQKIHTNGDNMAFTHKIFGFYFSFFAEIYMRYLCLFWFCNARSRGLPLKFIITHYSAFHIH